MRSSPGCLVTRSDSPVSSDSSTSMRPSPAIGPSTTTWSPGSSLQYVAEHHLRRVDLHDLPVAQHVRLGPQEDRHLVHHALGADLLEQADDRVGADHEHDRERVERLAQDQEQDPEEVEEVVDEVEDVVADDPAVAAAGADLDVVTLACRAPAVGLGRGQALEPGGDVVGGGGHRAETVSAPPSAVQCPRRWREIEMGSLRGWDGYTRDTG